jgi:hypothetical protein
MHMTFEEFTSSLEDATPPASLSSLLQAMWHDGNGDWEASHNIAQEIHSNEGSWIHAYLHRKEGDNSNAAYWYAKAGKKFPTIGLMEEWEDISKQLLNAENRKSS